MHDLQEYDKVKFIVNGEIHYGEIEDINDDEAEIFDFINEEYFSVPLENLEYIPPMLLTNEQAKKFSRFEITWSELTKDKPEYADVFFEEDRHIYTMQDLLAALNNIISSGKSTDEVYDEWFEKFYDYFSDYIDAFVCEETPADAVTVNGIKLTDRAEKITDILSALNELYYEYYEFPDVDFSVRESAAEMISDIEKYLEDEKKPVTERHYSDSEKEKFIDLIGNDDALKNADEISLSLYRKFVDDLCEKGNEKALKFKGYGCYGGNPAYECDWDTSLECMLKLYDLTGKPEYANTLGYIYYYGRCNDGVPEYEKAFRYFSVGAAGWIYESRYKLADMFANGYGVRENKDIACTLIGELYDQNLEYLLDGDFDCKFADVAFRLGKYHENRFYKDTSDFAAYAYYLEADFAIKRRLQYGYFGDQSVAANIGKALEDILDKGNVDRPKNVTAISPRIIFKRYLKKYRRLYMTIKKDGENVFLTFGIAPFEDEKYPPKMFITEPWTGFCGMLETVTLTVKNAGISLADDTEETIYFDDIYDKDYYLGDKKTASVQGDYYFENPVKESGEKYKFASVYFQAGGRHYDYLLDIDGVSVGDTVIVMTDRGETEVTVADILEKTESELSLPLDRYKKILKRKES